MRYSLVTILVGHPDEEIFDCGCDQTFAFSHLHNGEDQWVVRHKRGFLTEEQAAPLKTKTFDESGGL